MTRGLLFALIASSLGVAAPAKAQEADGLTIDQIAAVLNDVVTTSERHTADDGSGDYFIVEMTSDSDDSYSVVVAPSHCNGDVPVCTIVSIYANFTLDSAPDEATVRKAVKYNDTHFLGRAYTLDESVGVDHVVLLGNGAGKDYLAARLAEFPKILADFTSDMSQ